jgi:hypothetical protein
MCIAFGLWRGYPFCRHNAIDESFAARIAIESILIQNVYEDRTVFLP